MESSKSNSEYEAFIGGTSCDNNNDLKQECDNLLQTSGYDTEQKEALERELWQYSEEELNNLKANLYMNQVDRIELGLNYNQTDIKRKLRGYE